MSKKIILTADDYGANDFIDQGILLAIEEGIINSVAVFVTFNDSELRIRKLKALVDSENQKGNKIGIGLHFSLTAGTPIVKEHNSLTYTHSTNLLFRDAHNYPFHKIKEAEVASELEAQINTLAGWIGGVDNIDHVSNHHGVTYVDTSIFYSYCSKISEFTIPMRSPLNWSRSTLRYMDFDPLLPSVPLARQGINLRWAEKVFDVSMKRTSRRVQFAQELNVKFPHCLGDTFYGQPFIENLDFLVNQFNSHEFDTLENQCIELMFHLGTYNKSPMEKHPLEDIESDGISTGYYRNRKFELNAIRKYNWQVALQQLALNKTTFREM